MHSIFIRCLEASQSLAEPLLLCCGLLYVSLVVYVLFGRLPGSVADSLKGSLPPLVHSLSFLLPCFYKKQIREEDRSPPPSSPPPLFSVIPGGFIRQLVRETEKESKEARRRKQAALASPEREVSGPTGRGPGDSQYLPFWGLPWWSGG